MSAPLRWIPLFFYLFSTSHTRTAPRSIRPFQPSFSFLNRALVYYFSHSLVSLNSLTQTWITECNWRKITQQGQWSHHTFMVPHSNRPLTPADNPISTTISNTLHSPQASGSIPNTRQMRVPKRHQSHCNVLLGFMNLQLEATYPSWFFFVVVFF